MEITKENDTPVIHFPQRCEGKFPEEFVSLFKEEQYKDLKQVVIDFSETDFIDSSTIGVMVRVEKDFKLRNASLLLRNLKDNIVELFSDTGLDVLFNIETEKGLSEKVIDIFEESTDIRLEIKTEIKDDICVFHMGGVMNHPEGSRYFKQQFLLTMAEYKKILLDYEELTFFDSLSVSVVLSMNKLLKETGGSLRFCSANYIVNDLFATLNIDKIIPVYETIESALDGWD